MCQLRVVYVPRSGVVAGHHVNEERLQIESWLHREAQFGRNWVDNQRLPERSSYVLIEAADVALQPNGS